MPLKFQQIKWDRLDFGDKVIPIRNSPEILEVPDEYKDHPEVTRALKVDSLRWLEPPTPPAATETPNNAGLETPEEPPATETPKKRKGE
jgi:hypothetical protein